MSDQQDHIFLGFAQYASRSMFLLNLFGQSSFRLSRLFYLPNFRVLSIVRVLSSVRVLLWYLLDS